MSHKIEARSLPIRARQTIKDIPLYAKFLRADLDVRHNNCLLWTLQNDSVEDEAREAVEIIMLKLGEALEPRNAKYVSSFQTNAGMVHVFALRESEKLF
jgi:hypothetical protein